MTKAGRFFVYALVDVLTKEVRMHLTGITTATRQRNE